MSVTKFVTRKFGRLEVDDITGGSVSCTSVSAGSIRAPAFTGSTVACSTFTGGLNTNVPIVKGASITSATGVTITASQLLSGCIIRTGNDDAITDRLPSAENLIAQINVLTNTQASVGMSFDAVYFLNAASATSNSTLAAGTGATLGGLATFTSGGHTIGSRVLKVVIASMVGSTGGTYLASSTL